MSIEDVLNLGLKRFWFLYNQIERLRAEEDIRQLQLMTSVSDGDTFKSSYSALETEMGKVFIWNESVSGDLRIEDKSEIDPEFDRGGLAALKGLSDVKIGQIQ